MAQLRPAPPGGALFITTGAGYLPPSYFFHNFVAHTNNHIPDNLL